jgi:hypothetical protein
MNLPKDFRSGFTLGGTRPLGLTELPLPPN